MSQTCPQLHHLPANVREFWEAKQQALHDTLVRFSYSVLVEPTAMMLRETSGLLYLMEQNLWFEDFPKSSAFASLFQQNAGYTKTQIQLPRAAITDARLTPAAELGQVLLGKRPSSSEFLAFFRVFAPRPTTLVLTARDAAGQPVHCAFRDLDDAEAWYHALSPSEAA
jgi:hypothetical protein